MHGGIDFARRSQRLKLAFGKFKFADVQIFAQRHDKRALTQLWHTIFIGRFTDA